MAVSTGLKVAAYGVSVLAPLAVSTSQGGQFFYDLGDGTSSWALLALAGTIVCSSVIIGHLVGVKAGEGKYGHVALGVCIWLAIVWFSTATSSLHILKSSDHTIQTQITENPRNRAINDSIRSNQETISGLQAQIRARDPVKWATKRERWAKQIADLQAQNERLMGRQQLLYDTQAGSSTARAFQDLESHGVTRVGLARLAAFLLDAIPFVVSIMLGASMKGGRRAPGKP